MSSLGAGSLNATATGYSTVALGAATQLRRALGENTQTVSFVSNGVTLVTFDAVVQESHSVDAQPTAFPIEDGSTISDHVIRMPRELSLQGIKTDTPLDNKDLLVDEAITSAAGLVAGPLGVFALQQSQAYASSRAIGESISPSIATYRQIVAMATGRDGQPPMPFTVRTAITEYPNMMIKQVQVPRDVTTGAALVFGITLTSMRIVSSVTVAATINEVPKQNLQRKREGEVEAPKVGEAYKEGVNNFDSVVGKQARFADAPAVYTGR